MTNPTWGTLAKAQDDNTTVDAEIDAKIAAHEADPEAHQGEGESLQNHKSDDIIDHPADSVITDKIPNDTITPEQLIFKQAIMRLIDFGPDDVSITYSGTSNLIQNGINTILNTDGTSGHYIKVSSNSTLSYYNQFNLHNSFFTCVAKTNSSSNVTTYLGYGTITTDFVGFKIVNSTVYACTFKSSSEYLTEAIGVDPTVMHLYHVRHTQGVSDEFFIDSILIHKEETHYLTATSGAYFTFKITQNENGVVKTLSILNCEFHQDL